MTTRHMQIYVTPAEQRAIIAAATLYEVEYESDDNLPADQQREVKRHLAALDSLIEKIVR